MHDDKMYLGLELVLMIEETVKILEHGQKQLKTLIL